MHEEEQKYKMQKIICRIEDSYIQNQKSSFSIN